MIKQLTRRRAPATRAAPDAGPLDDRLYDLVETRVRRLLSTTRSSPRISASTPRTSGWATRAATPCSARSPRTGRTSPASRRSTTAALSPAARFERDLELHNLRLGLFERTRSGAGSAARRRRRARRRGVPAVRARRRAAGRAPRADRRPARGGAGVPRCRADPRRRPAVAVWQRTEARYAARPAGPVRRGARGGGRRARRRGARPARAGSIARRERRAGGPGRWVARDRSPTPPTTGRSGAERYDELVRLRAFGDLDADAILQIGLEQLRANLDARRAAAHELDPDADLPAVIDRLKSDQPATFEEALEGYRDVMRRARAYLVEHDLVTIPPDEAIEVIATPEYLRSVMPFAAYFLPARFDADQRGLYIVTPAVDDDPNAMREHYWASISNTSIHEAYPGHHLQLVGRLASPVAHPDAHRRARVRRGLGNVLRADDARGGLRRRSGLPCQHVHRRRVAGLPDRARRADAPRRADARGGGRLPGRAHGLRGARMRGPRSAATRTRRATS